MINYEEIIENLEIDRVEALFDSLDIEWEDKGSFLLLPTVCHNEDASEASHKLYFYKDTHLFVCYTNCGNMSIFKFLKNFYDTRGLEYDWNKDVLQVILNCSSSGLTRKKETYRSIRDVYKKEEVKKLEVYPKGLMSIYPTYYPIEWLSDGITKDTMDKFGIKFSHEHNKIIIPHYNPAGDLVGIRGRALNEWEIENVGKYLPVPIEGKWYSHPLSLNLYGLNITKENIRAAGVCYLFESEKAVMQMDNFNMPNCAAAVCGSKVNKYHIKQLIENCSPKEIVICFDKEELPGETIYFDKLYEIAKKYENYAKISFVYDRENLLDLKDSPTDKGEEIFRKLLKRRVNI